MRRARRAAAPAATTSAIALDSANIRLARGLKASGTTSAAVTPASDATATATLRRTPSSWANAIGSRSDAANVATVTSHSRVMW